MKKTTTAANQPVKVDASSETPVQHASHKMHRNHKFLDHTHGRVNKTPIGINFAPGCFSYNCLLPFPQSWVFLLRECVGGVVSYNANNPIVFQSALSKQYAAPAVRS